MVDYPFAEKLKKERGTTLRAYDSSTDVVLRPERLKAKLLLYTSLLPEDKDTPINTGLCDVMLSTSRDFASVGVPLSLKEEDVVNLSFCQAHNILVWKGWHLRAVDFLDKKAARIGVRQQISGIINSLLMNIVSPELMKRLLQLTIKDACIGLGLNPDSINIATRNDVLVNGRKISGMSIQHVSSGHALVGRLYCNLGLDKQLMEGALKDKEGVAKATSISAELGEPVSEDAFGELVLQSLSKRFNMDIVEWQRRP